jgi:GT2 family glycosyltransferase
MAPTGDIALVVVTRDRVQRLCETLPRHLELPERPRVVLIDDGSVDGTADVVARRFPSVELIRLPVARGAVARNLALERLTERYVAFSDDDAWFAPGSLSQAVAVMEQHPRLAVLNPRILVGEARRVDPVCTAMASSPVPPAPGQHGRPLLSFVACAVVARRAALAACGGFCERFGVGGEEKLLGWDLVSAGWQLSYAPEVLAHHCPPPNDGRPRRRAQTIRNELWTQWLRRPTGSAVRATARELRRGRLDRVTLRAFTSAAAGAGWVLRERRRCPAGLERVIALVEDST